MSYAVFTLFRPGSDTIKSHNLVIIDEYDENEKYVGKILATAYEDTDSGTSMGFLTQVLASILNDYEVPADSLVSRLKEWFDEVTYNKVEQ